MPIRIKAVFPQDVRESKQYLNDLNVSIDQVRQLIQHYASVQTYAPAADKKAHSPSNRHI